MDLKGRRGCQVVYSNVLAQHRVKRLALVNKVITSRLPWELRMFWVHEQVLVFQEVATLLRGVSWVSFIQPVTLSLQVVTCCSFRPAPFFPPFYLTLYIIQLKQLLIIYQHPAARERVRKRDYVSLYSSLSMANWYWYQTSDWSIKRHIAGNWERVISPWH